MFPGQLFLEISFDKYVLSYCGKEQWNEHMGIISILSVAIVYKQQDERQQLTLGHM